MLDKAKERAINMFALRFDKSLILEWSKKYPQDYDTEIETSIAPDVCARGYFLKDEFQELCKMK